LNDTTLPLLVDTGGGFSSLSEKAVNALGLKPRESRVESRDLYGNVSEQFVRLDAIELGGLKGKNVNLMIWAGRDVSFAGLIAGDMLEHYDVELNFVTRKLNLFSQDHCEGRVVYWPAASGTVVPFTTRSRFDTRIRVPVTLDGKHFQALVDTGAPSSVIGAGVAKEEFGITAASPGAGKVDDDQAFSYVFHNLTFGGIAISNPQVMIHPDLVGTKDIADSIGSAPLPEYKRMDADMLIGMDALTHFHLYIAYGERKLYITPPDQPAAAAATTPNQSTVAADGH
jgi:hypothetical protein